MRKVCRTLLHTSGQQWVWVEVGRFMKKRLAAASRTSSQQPASNQPASGEPARLQPAASQQACAVIFD